MALGVLLDYSIEYRMRAWLFLYAWRLGYKPREGYGLAVNCDLSFILHSGPFVVLLVYYLLAHL